VPKSVLSIAATAWRRMGNGRAIICFEDYVYRKKRKVYVFQGMCYLSVFLERLKKTISLQHDRGLSPDYNFVITALDILYCQLFTQRATRNGKTVSVNLSLQTAQGINFLMFLCPL
jgi:hypothetical protein